MYIANQKQQLEKLAQTGYTFNFESYLSEGWKALRKSIAMYIIYTIVVFAGSLIISLIPILGTIALIIISPSLNAGYYIATRKNLDGGEAKLDDFFKGFDYFGQLAIYGLIGGILTVLAFFLLVLPGIWFAVAVICAPLMIVFARLEFWDAIVTSVKLVSKKWFHWFALIIVLGLINVLGALALGIGMLITIPLTYCVIYAAYADITKHAGAQSMDTGEHLVDF